MSSILKVEGKFLTPEQLNLVALVAENATVNIISGGKVKNKIEVKVPELLEGIVLCPNSGCITNDPHEKLDPKVHYDEAFKCHYCSREFGRDELMFRDY